jgi:hypothetical protein
MKKKKASSPKKPKSTKKIPVVVELPTGPAEMENFVNENRVLINEMLVDSLDYAVRKNFTGIEVFAFKNSSYVVIVNRKDFRDNLQNIFDYSLENQIFETCAKAKKVMDLMDKFSFSMSVKKTKPK